MEERISQIFGLVAHRARVIVEKTGKDINILALRKPNEELYIFIYDDNSIAQVLKMLDQFASDQNLSFHWYDASVMSRGISKKHKKIPKSN